MNNNTNVMQNCGEVISLTFGDQGENHVGMEKVGAMVQEGEGFNLEDLEGHKREFEEWGVKCEIYDLRDLVEKDSVKEAYILVVRGVLSHLIKNKEDLFSEMKTFEWDRKYYCTRRKKVLNKHARANVCFGEVSSEPDYENKKGRVVGYGDAVVLGEVRKRLMAVLGKKGDNLICEGNRYFDLRKCGIGWHGDAERRKVVALRLGEEMDMQFRWFHRFNSCGKTLKLKLQHGDMYIMSEKAVGTDWKRSSQWTVRHAAGREGSKYLKVKR